MLYDNQKEISQDIIKNLENKILFNIPTATGKTYILLDVAQKQLTQNPKKKVIISTSNNALVFDMEDTAKKAFGFKDNLGIKIGHKNYISYERLIYNFSLGILDEYLDNQSVKDFIENQKKKDHILFSTFDDKVTYKDVASSELIKDLICVTPKEIDIPFADLTITNHFYLLQKAIYDKEFNIEDYTILIDEVHEINAVADSILVDSFSLYDLKGTLNHLVKTIKNDKKDFIGKKSLLEGMQTVRLRTQRILQKHTSPHFVGEYQTNPENVNPIATDVSLLKEAAVTARIKKQVSKYLSENNKNILKYADHFKTLEKAFSKLSNAADQIKYQENNPQANNLGISYSPSKGYPTILMSKSEPIKKLHYEFWNKITSSAGVSATVSALTKNTTQNRYAYTRLGIVISNKDTNPCKILAYNRPIPKENTTFFISNEIPEMPNFYAKEFDKTTSEYLKKTAEYIFKNHNKKNCMISCGGYKVASIMGEYFKQKFPEVPITIADPKSKTTQTIKDFKQKGGVLFATRNFNTGMSLEGKHLEKLFILKAPYDDFGKKKWKELETKIGDASWKQKNQEMYISLMQLLGRVARTKTDTGELHLLFEPKKKVSKAITEILNLYATPKKKEVKITESNVAMTSKDEEETLAMLMAS